MPTPAWNFDCETKGTGLETTLVTTFTTPIMTMIHAIGFQQGRLHCVWVTTSPGQER